MKIVSIILIITGLAAVISIILYCTKWLSSHKANKLELFEPDLKVMDKPEMLAKIPENETTIPDSNSRASNKNRRAG
ncbi:MAG: hypothetical protein ABIQ95_12490 [Bdellovibrionia bacterium]